MATGAITAAAIVGEPPLGGWWRGRCGRWQPYTIRVAELFGSLPVPASTSLPCRRATWRLARPWAPSSWPGIAQESRGGTRHRAPRRPGLVGRPGGTGHADVASGGRPARRTTGGHGRCLPATSYQTRPVVSWRSAPARRRSASRHSATPAGFASVIDWLILTHPQATPDDALAAPDGTPARVLLNDAAG
jgi:hypothetical protein